MVGGDASRAERQVPIIYGGDPKAEPAELQ